MNRTTKAIVTVIFGYAQYGLALVSGLFLLPFTLAHLDVRDYGLWQVCLELMVFVGFIDLGVINVLPWMIAECDGRKDRREMRTLFVSALTLAIVGSAVYLGTVALAWPVLPWLTGLDAAQLQRFEGPLLMVVGLTALLFPLRVFYAVLAGLQDVAFLGWFTLAQAALTIAMTITLLSLDYGLFALAWASVPVVLYCLVAAIRLFWVAPDLFVEWPRPRLRPMLALVGQGLTTWVAALGWRMTAASNGLWIISSGGLPETVVIFSCTAKLGEMLMQLAWQCSDGALAGLAQLQGEGRQERVRQVVLLMLRVLLVCVGGAVHFLLVVNPAFVAVWVGVDKWGGYWLNILFGLSILSLSVTHGLFVPAAVVRLKEQLTGNHPDALLVGHFGTYYSLLTPALQESLTRLLQRNPRVHLCLLGAGGDRFAQGLLVAHPEWPARIHAPGRLGADEVSWHLQALDLIVQPYPDGVSSRRTSLMSALVHGVPAVTTLGPCSETICREEAGAVLVPVDDCVGLVQAVEALLADPARRLEAGTGGRAFYERHFALTHTLAVLQLADGQRKPVQKSTLQPAI